MSTPRLQITRTFNWGLLVINDRGSDDPVAEAPTAPAVAVATSSTAAIAVRHAQDTDLGEEPATVTIEVFVGVPPEGATDFDATLAISSGTLELGDAEAVDQLELATGDWDLSLIARPADHPDNVVIWLNPHTPTGADSYRHSGANSG